MGKYTHLHVHSEFSLLDGLIKIPDLIAKVKDFGMNSVALTDHGVMYGTYEFWKKCREAGIKPIIGVEAYVALRTRFDKVAKIDDKRYHLVLLAKNLEGYKNLVKLVTAAHLEGFYYRPRIDKELIKKYGKGLIGLSACLAGVVNNHLHNKQEKKAKQWADFLKNNLDEFYIEIQRNGVKEAEKLVPTQLKFAEENSLPVVATCDSHYLNKEDWYAQEVLWAINDGKKMDDDSRRKAWSEEFYIKSNEEINKLYEDIPQAVENTQKIAESIEEFDITFDRIQPKYKKLEQGENAKNVLKRMTFEGAEQRYGKITKEIQDRIEYELDLIHKKGYDDYFLVVQDYVTWAMGKGIMVGPGRGSGAGSVVAYSLKITNLDPFKFELYFERFLNPERMSPPDFDIDFQDDRRDELFTYMSKTYGRDNTSFIGTFGRMKTRSAIRDVSRVLDIDLEVADRLSKMVDVKFGKVAHMTDMIDKNSEFRDIINSDPQLKKLSEIVQKVEGISRHVSTHACGYLVTPTPTVNYVPLQKETRGGTRIMSQIEGSSLEDLGLMKFDFLGLTNLTIIRNTIEIIKQSRNEVLDIDNISLEDNGTYELFQRTETTAVFQFESDGIRKYLKDLKPTVFEDLIFLIAAYRPGPMKLISDYIDRKYGRQKVMYLHKKLEPILKNTYGIAIYQEQVLRIAVDMAGYSLGEADILRRAIGKKKSEVMKAEKEKFINGCIKEGHSKDVANKLYAYIEPFADYGFNRAHAASYALISYQTAYLKVHYPIEFLAGLMQTDLEVSDKIARDILEAERMGIKVLPPHINKSDVGFKIEGEKEIRFGLAAIKNVGVKIIKNIVAEREEGGNFNNLDELIVRVGTKNLTKKVLECLIKTGTMDQFGEKNALLEIMPIIVDRINKIEKKSQGGQSGLFETDQGKVQMGPTPLPDVRKVSEREKLSWEKELIGTYLTSHPLKKYRKYYGEDILDAAAVKKMSKDRTVKVGGIIADKRKIITKRGNRPMAFIRIECIQDSIEGVVFNGIYEKYRDKLELERPYVFIGKTACRQGQVSLIIDEMKSFSSFEPSITNGNSTITLDISKEKSPMKLRVLKQTIVDNPGDYKLVIYYSDSNGKKQKKELKKRIKMTRAVKDIIEEYIVS